MRPEPTTPGPTLNLILSPTPKARPKPKPMQGGQIRSQTLKATTPSHALRPGPSLKPRLSPSLRPRLYPSRKPKLPLRRKPRPSPNPKPSLNLTPKPASRHCSTRRSATFLVAGLVKDPEDAGWS
jgi:hypothetical protein